MGIKARKRIVGWVGLLLGAWAGLGLAAEPAVLSDGIEARDPSSRFWSVQFDNDLLSGTHRDEDYSWGLAATFAHDEMSATQFGLIAMTPRDLTIKEPQANDRPYASLVFMTRAGIEVDAAAGRATYSSVTLGVLGLDAAEFLQRHIHSAFGGKDPQGWQHQVSAGGEPTARLVRAEQWLLVSSAPWAWGRPEIKATLSGSAGYLTEGSASVSMRWGRVESAWWTHTPELTDYIATPLKPATGRLNAQPDLYFFAGGRLKMRAYNAFLQGQFRHSDVRIESGDLSRWQGEAWAGLVTGWSTLRITYTLRLASREVETGSAARTLLWGGIAVDKSF